MKEESLRNWRFKRSLTRELQEKEAAFLAGVIEARGMLSIHKNENGYLWPYLAITSYDRAFLENTKNLIGNGSVLQQKKTSSKICWRLTINDTEGIIQLLGQVIPYLKLLKGRAKILFNFCARRLESPSFTTEDWEAHRMLSKRGD